MNVKLCCNEKDLHQIIQGSGAINSAVSDEIQ